MQARVELFSDSICEVAESPFWHNDALWWVDVNPGVLYRCSEAHGIIDTWQLGDRTGAVVPVPESPRAFYAAQQGGIHQLLIDGADCSLTLIVDPEPHLPNNRFNDGKLDSRGRLWAGTMSISLDPKQGALYKLEDRKSITKAVDAVTLSNGLAWSPDDTAFYYIDTTTRRIDIFDFDAAAGSISNRRCLRRCEEDWGNPDGMTVDSRGFLWVAFWGGSCVRCISPADGSVQNVIRLPCPNVTSCCFGGAAGDTLFITTASKNTDQAAFPDAGKIFSVAKI